MNEKVLESAYVKEEALVLDPTQLPEAAIERLPHPTGWRILLLPFLGMKKAGSIFLPDQTIEREDLATFCGYVLRVGSLAYKDDEKFGGVPWCKEKDWVIFGRYAGSRFKIEGGEVRILNDVEIIATISDPTDIVHM